MKFLSSASLAVLISIPMFLTALPEAKASDPNAGMTPLPGALGRVKRKTDNAKDDKFTSELKQHCQRHFPGLIQGELRSACTSSAEIFQTQGMSLAQTRCRVNYGEEPRLVMGCLIGVAIASDMTDKKEEFLKKLQLCAEQYPQHTEIDAFLQESCLTGIYLPELKATNDKKGFEACAQISPERSFLGPCAVGLSFADHTSDDESVMKQNSLCEQYFDHKRFHLTYRACLNARSIAIPDGTSPSDTIQSCSNIVSDPGNDSERAACFVGANIHRSLLKKDDLAKKFQKCGETKVSYQDRDVLACLTAASLLDFGGRPHAENGCKDVFKGSKSSSRSDCVNSLALFTEKKTDGSK